MNNLLKLPLVLLTLCFAALPGTRAQDTLTDGLVAYYPFNGNANDQSGFGRHGTVHGAILSPDRFGIPNNCYAFNGVSDYIDASTTINDVINTFTVSMWFNTTNAHFAYPSANFLIWPSHGVLTWGDSSVGAGISAGVDKLQVWEHTADYLVIVVEYDGTLTGWNFVTLVYSNRVPGLYVNGAFVGQGSESLRNPVRPSNGQKYEPVFRERGGFGGGQQDASTNQMYQGRIDDVRIYNRALSGSEVQQLFVQEGPFCSPHRATATATVVNGFVVGATITDAGCGYTNAPLVLIQGGGGSGAVATAVVSKGVVVALNITSAGSGYTSTPRIEIASPPFVPTLSINVSKVKVTQNVVLGRNYVLESSTDMTNWTAVGPPFTATSESVTDEFDVDVTGRYFRIRQVP